MNELEDLLSSDFHEHRHTALLMLVSKFEKSQKAQEKKEIVEFYLKNKKYINNCDLVDNSIYKIIGRYCFENQGDTILNNLANEDNLWSKRMAIVGTMFHVKKGSFNLVKKLAIKKFTAFTRPYAQSQRLAAARDGK